jgi:hypothetical protein
MSWCYCRSDRGRQAEEKFNGHGAMDAQCRNCGRWASKSYSFGHGLVTQEQRIAYALKQIRGVTIRMGDIE